MHKVQHDVAAVQFVLLKGVEVLLLQQDISTGDYNIRRLLMSAFA